jgi:two-component system, LytTR family, response regulator
MPPLRVLIVDDERPARQKIRRYLETEPDITVIGEAANGRDAVAAITEHRPDLVFLDVQMPGLDGFAVIEALDFEPLPQVIFITAHDQFALRAFEVSALDYLLKPFEPARFKRVLDRARQFLQRDESNDLSERMSRLLTELRSGPRYVERLLVHAEGRAFFLRVESLRFIEAAKNYIHLHAAKEVYRLRGTIEGLQQRLDPAKFLRVNRSQIINLDSVKELHPWFHGEYRIILNDGTEINWSRRYIDKDSTLLADRF